MWQYTTETIINSNKGRLADGSRAQVYKNDGTDLQGTPTAATDVLIIDGVGSYILGNITGMYKYAYRKPAKAHAFFVDPTNGAKESDNTTLTYTKNAGEVLRLIITLREEGRSTSYMQNAYLRHHKNFFYEIKSTGVWANDIEALKKLVNKEMALTDFDFFKADVVSGKLVIEAKDYYIRFAEAPRIDKINAASVAQPGAYLGFQDYVEFAKATVDVTGDLGAGTVDHLIKDLRLPSNANINPFGPDNGGKPIPGGQYTQYLIEYTTDRHHVAGGVMGSVNEKSLTSHILFLEETGAKAIIDLLDKCAAYTKSDAKPEIVSNAAPAVPKQKPGSVQ